MGDVRQVRAAALREAADKWTRGGWSDAPRHADRAQDRIAYANYVGDWLREQADSLAEDSASATEADMRAFGASDAACYKWPGDTEKDRACRAAYMEGAADSGGVADGWRDIADAPRDGTHVLMWRDTKVGATVAEAWWRTDGEFGDGWGGHGWMYPTWQQPTHWLPLPAPPKV